MLHFLLRLYFRGEKDVKALYGISYDDSSLVNTKKHAMSNGTLRAYSSSENIAEDETDHVQPDQVIRIYKADHTSKYFVIYQVWIHLKLCASQADYQFWIVLPTSVTTGGNIN